MRLSVELSGDSSVLFETLIAQMQIKGTKSEKSEKLVKIALSALEQAIEQEKAKTGKRFPSLSDMSKSLEEGRFELDH